MKRDLKSMNHSASFTPEEMRTLAGQADPAMINSVQKTIDAYSGKSESELMNELKRITGAQMNAGQLTPEGMDAVAQKLSPMLTPQQRARMQAVLRQLKGQ